MDGVYTDEESFEAAEVVETAMPLLRLEKPDASEAKVMATGTTEAELAPGFKGAPSKSALAPKNPVTVQIPWLRSVCRPPVGRQVAFLTSLRHSSSSVYYSIFIFAVYSCKDFLANYNSCKIYHRALKYRY
ncbi:MAG: hypothetical protein SVV80_14075 [Planctomycetota bacterium]|nr:hypothetical protein [Planctomycetota bacterium]